MFQWFSNSQQPSSQSVVLDLDETLVHTFSSRDKLTAELKANPDVADRLYTLECREGTFWGIKRPHLDEFMDYVADRFDHVGVWSAGTEGYVSEVVKAIQPRCELACVLSRGHCDQVHTEYVDDEGVVSYPNSPELCKPLNHLFEKYPAQFNRYNTWVIDDRQDYAKENLLNWLAIPPFAPSLKSIANTEDDYLLRLMDWFDQDEVRFAPNVLEVLKDWY
jgi:hypothetical protein